MERRARAARATRPGSCSRRSGWPRYALFLGLAEGDALRFLDVQEAWYRELSGAARRRLGGPRGGRGRRCASCASGQREVVYFEQAAGDPYRIAAINLMLFGLLVFAVAACVGVFRRLPPPTAPGWPCRWCCR